jgi:hypothetical protein
MSECRLTASQKDTVQTLLCDFVPYKEVVGEFGGDEAKAEKFLLKLGLVAKNNELFRSDTQVPTSVLWYRMPYDDSDLFVEIYSLGQYFWYRIVGQNDKEYAVGMNQTSWTATLSDGNKEAYRLCKEGKGYVYPDDD